MDLVSLEPHADLATCDGNVQLQGAARGPGNMQRQCVTSRTWQHATAMCHFKDQFHDQLRINHLRIRHTIDDFDLPHYDYHTLVVHVP